MSALPKFTMEFEPTTIEHLGLKLYASLPPVIGELVSNAWDADAPTVEVEFPVGNLPEGAEVIVKDFGSGMDAEAIQNAYLHIGRNRREIDGEFSPKGRPLMGRKGLGKLSAFGIADELQVRSVKSGYAICIRLNYGDMQSWPKDKSYEPKVVPDLSGPTSEPNGTEVRVRNLRRQKPIEPEWIRRELARRYTVIGDDFKVFVNRGEITFADRRLKEQCTKAWDVSELPNGGIIDAERGLQVSGWIGLVEKSSQTDRGVDIFAKGKAVELDTMFGVKTTHIQFARAYVVGEVHAEFLDAKIDNISTARNSAQWESVAGQKLQEWGSEALKYVFKQWLEIQRKKKEETIIRIADFDKWLATRTTHEQRVAQRLVKIIVDDPDIEPESAERLLEIIKTNVEFEAFRELVDEIEESGTNVHTLLKLFEGWRIIEAREHLRLADGRFEVMEKLSRYIKEGALEVQEIQPLFEKNGWLVNPTWGDVTGQTRYTKLLRENCVEPRAIDPKDRRIDILGYTVSGNLQVVELKRPEKTLSRDDLEQVEKYVDWARANLASTGDSSVKYVSGLLVVGKLSKDSAIQNKMERLAGDDIRVCTYDDLMVAAETLFGEVERRLKAIAPEYSREARRARKKKKK